MWDPSNNVLPRHQQHSAVVYCFCFRHLSPPQTREELDARKLGDDCEYRFVNRMHRVLLALGTEQNYTYFTAKLPAGDRP